MKRKESGTSKKRVFIFGLFLLYIVILLYFLFLSEEMGRKESVSFYRYNLAPFREISRYINRYHAFGFWRVFLNLGGNILAFVPFGLLFPLLFQVKKRRGGLNFIVGLLFVLTVEGIQLVTMVGSFDVDDILLNMTGILLGYFLCRRIFFGKANGEEA